MPAERPTRQKHSERRHHPYRDKRAAKQRSLVDESRDLSTIPLSRHIDFASGYLLDLLIPICASDRVPAEMALNEAERRKDIAKQKLSERRKQLNYLQQELNRIDSQINTYTVNLTNLQETMAIIQGFQGCASHVEKMTCDCHHIIREKELLVKARNAMEEGINAVSEDSRQLKAEEAAAVKAIEHHTDSLAFAGAHAHVARIFHTLLSVGIEGISNTWDAERIQSLAAIVNGISKKEKHYTATCEKHGGT